MPAICEHRKAQHVVSVYPSFGLFHPKQHLRIFSNVTNIPFPTPIPLILATSAHLDLQIHQLSGKAAEGLILYEELSVQRSWDFLKLHPLTQDHQQLVITSAVSARVPFLVFKFFIVLYKQGVQYSLSVHWGRIYHLSLEKSCLPVPTATVWMGRGKSHPSY